MAGAAYLAQEGEVSPFVVPINSVHENLVTDAPSTRLRRIPLASASCSDARAVLTPMRSHCFSYKMK
jgi:hypothetical protein